MCSQISVYFLSCFWHYEIFPMLGTMTLSYHTSNPNSPQNRCPIFTTFWQTWEAQIILNKKEKERENTWQVMQGVGGKGGNPTSLRQEVSIPPICVFAGMNCHGSLNMLPFHLGHPSCVKFPNPSLWLLWALVSNQGQPQAHCVLSLLEQWSARLWFRALWRVIQEVP